jgi:hypothetical protein
VETEDVDDEDIATEDSVLAHGKGEGDIEGDMIQAIAWRAEGAERPTRPQPVPRNSMPSRPVPVARRCAYVPVEQGEPVDIFEGPSWRTGRPI